MKKSLSLLLVMVFFIVLWAGHACAQQSESATAGKYYLDEGNKALAAGDQAKAKFYFELSTMLDPGNKEAKQSLEKLAPPAPQVTQAAPEVETVMTKPEEGEEVIEATKAKPGAEQAEAPQQTPLGSFVSKMNEKIAPWKVSGETRASFGIQRDDFIWNESNYDLWEKNWRQLWGDDRENTYDPGVFDRLRVDVDRQQETGFSLHSNITIDPWSYVGQSSKVTVTGAWGDPVDLQLKWWSNTGKTINETYYTRRFGDSIGVPEIKVKNGKTVPTTVTSAFGDTFTIPEIDIDKTFMPLREFWVDYKQENYKIRVFPIAYQDQAYTSDDPLSLSNHHIYWEPSPWLDQWAPGIENWGAGSNDFSQGRWSGDLAFYTRDGDGTRLTSLRGFSFYANPFEGTQINVSAASPKNIWQGYDSFDSFPGAVRLKQTLNDSLTIGGIYTFRLGFTPKMEQDAENHVFAADIDYEFLPDVHLKAEAGTSMSKQDRISQFSTKDRGNVFQASIQKPIIRNEHGELDKGVYGGQFTLTHMDDGFDPGLANYNFTRDDAFWGRHIFFDNPNPKKSIMQKEFYEGFYKPTLTYFDIVPFRIGDGIDVGRNVVRFNAEARPTERLELLADVRNVHNTNGKYIETVARGEASFKINPKLTLKAMAIYTDLPKTHAGIDPFLVDYNTGQPYLNTMIEDGKDPSLGTLSLGLRYDATKWLTLVGIYEYTNDREMATDNFPRGLFSGTSMATMPYENFMLRYPINFEYGQSWFAQPPYDYFNIVRLKTFLMPMENLDIKLEYTFNDNKFAGGIDDNINHASVEVDYQVTKKAAVGVGYVFSRCIDYSRLAANNEKSFEDHHNVFGEFRYKVRDSGRLLAQYGISTRVTPDTLTVSSPYGGFSPTLDTVHLFKVMYIEQF